MFGKRYLAIGVSIFAIGVIFGIKVFDLDTFSLRAIFITIAVLSVCSFAFFAYVKTNFNTKKILAVAFAVAAFSFGVVRVWLYDDAISYSSRFDGKSDTATFEISEIKETSVDVEIVSSEIGVPEGESVRLYIDLEKDGLVAGDLIVAEVTYSVQKNEYFYSNGIALSAHGEALETKEGNGSFCKIRRFVSETATELYYGFEYAGPISKAVSIGDKSGVDSYLYTIYNSGGISHILAISGLHISLIAMCLHRFLLLISVNKKVACIISSSIVLLYAAFVGFTPSVSRASIMMLLIMLSRMFLRRADSITALFIALGLLLIFNPYSIFAVGLQLSFLSSLAILVCEPLFDRVTEFFKVRAEEKGRVGAFVYKALNLIIMPGLLSFATTVFSFSVICSSFDSVSYISPIVNIIAVPLFSYALIFAIIAFAVAAVSLPIAVYIAKPAGYLFDFISGLGESVHTSDIGKLSSHIDLIIVPCIISLIMIASLLFMRRKRFKVFGISAVSFCLSIMICGLLNGYMNKGVTIIEYGNAKGEYVFFRNDETSIYFDLGGYTSESEMVYEKGFTSVEKYITLKYSNSSYKKFEDFCGSMSVSQIFLPEPKNIYEINMYIRIKELANQRNCDIIIFDKDLCFELNEVSVVLIRDDSLGNGSLISFERPRKSVCIFEGDFPALGECDVAVFSDFSEKEFANAFFDEMFFIESAVENTSFEGYLDTFKERIKITTKDGESEIEIYEP